MGYAGGIMMSSGLVTHASVCSFAFFMGDITLLKLILYGCCNIQMEHMTEKCYVSLKWEQL